MNEYVLEVTGVTKDFPGVRALDNVHLELVKGEILGLVGENGAGKSTLLKILNGLYPRGTYQGKIKIDGQEVEFKSPRDAHAKGIGYVPQEINVLNRLSLAENIYVEELNIGNPGRPFVDFSRLNKRATRLMQSLGLQMDAETKVAFLSTAEKQLLMIARALTKDVPILILDEPTTALTADETQHLFNILNDIKNRGTSIIFVTHKMEEIMQVTDRVTILRDGKYVSTYARHEYDDKVIVRDMVGRTVDVFFPPRQPRVGQEVLRLEHVSVEHPTVLDKYLIEDVSFSLHQGEILGLAGLMGAGRTEVLRTIYGHYRTKSGKIFVNDTEIQLRSEGDAMRLGIGFITEDRKKDGLLMLNDIMRNISVSNFPAIVNKLSFVNSKAEWQRSDKYKQLMQIKAESVESKVVSLSGGNQQKVLLAKALNSDAQIILLDEPTKGIDVGSKTEIYHIINELVSRDMAVILVSSELPELLAMSDRFVVLSGGKLVGELSKKEASQDRIMMMCVN